MTVVAYWVRGHSAFELDCGSNRKTRVVFGLYDKSHTDLAWYLFSSSLSPKGQKACDPDTSVMVWDDPFGEDAGIATNHLFDPKIDLDQLVSDLKSPFATMSIDPGIECQVNFNSKSNGRDHLAFHLHQNFKPPVPPGGKPTFDGRLYFLGRVPFSQKAFSQGPQGAKADVTMHGQVS